MQKLNYLFNYFSFSLADRQKVDPDAPSTSQNRDVPGVSNDKKRQRNPNKVRTKSHL